MTLDPPIRGPRHAVLGPSQPSDVMVSVGVGPAGEAVPPHSDPTPPSVRPSALANDE